jgi:hypothetical protein
MKLSSWVSELVRQFLDRTPKPGDWWFLVQLFARGGARICTPDEKIPLLETVIQPDGDVVTKVWEPEAAGRWEEHRKREWEEYVRSQSRKHLKTLGSRTDCLRSVRFMLHKLLYLSSVPTAWGLYRLFRQPSGWGWLVIITEYAIVPFLILLIVRVLMPALCRCVLKCVAGRFSEEEWTPVRPEG